MKFYHVDPWNCSHYPSMFSRSKRCSSSSCLGLLSPGVSIGAWVRVPCSVEDEKMMEDADLPTHPTQYSVIVSAYFLAILLESRK